MSSYLLGKGQFIYLSAGFSFFIPISDFIGLNLKGDSWIPICNIWADNGLPFSDGFMTSITVGVRFSF